MINATHPDTAEARPFQPQPGGRYRITVALAVSLLSLGLAAGAYLWWRDRQAGPAAPVAAPAPIAATDAASAPPPAEPAIRHPIESAALAAPSTWTLPPLDQADAAVVRGLTEVLGARPVIAMLQTAGFVRRAVATIDNLGRAHAAPRLWPVLPSGGRFSVQGAADAEFIAAANAARYAGFVGLVESIDTPRAAALYVGLYPLFQQAYQELGYPRGYFNDRLVEVIDGLLATPEPAGPIAVRLTKVKGPIESERPWVRYEFADPALEALPAGSKMLLRVGTDHARRLKSKLAEFRAAIAPARKP